MKKIIIALIIIMISVGVWYRFFRKEEVKEPESRVKMKPISVETALVGKGTLVKYIDGEGILEAVNTQKVISELSGYIKSNVKDGDQIKKGDLLAVIDNEKVKIALNEALLAYQKNFAETYSLEKIFNEKFNNDTYDYDKIKNLDFGKFLQENEKNVESALKKGEKNRFFRLGENELYLKKAFEDYKKLFIVAKVNGVVGNINFDNGELIESGRALMQIDDTSMMTAKMNVMEEDIARIIENNKVYCNFLALKDTVIAAKVSAVNRMIDPESHLGYIRVNFENNENKLFSGMYCTAKIEAEKLENRLIIPNEAMLFRENRDMVFTVEHGRSYWKFVKIDNKSIFFTEILEGISAGDTVVTTNNYTMIHDAPLKVEKVKNMDEFINFEKE